VELIIQITVPGEPVAQARARYTARHGFVRTYDPKTSADYKAYIRRLANQIDSKPIDGPVVMMVDIFRAVPKSWSKKKRNEALAGKHKPIIKPDLSNYLKGIEDALNGIAYLDDSQIVWVIVRKKYDAEPRVEIRIWPDSDENNEKYYSEVTS
jgi:Holliday junction resolvase RusA-like endonuclease